ncbi:MAG: LacI family DNA-binding transcriptional regulator [Clostridium sp.]|nr:LacI family DNA-binding transcriptional regulator [Clostridium sp.]
MRGKPAIIEIAKALNLSRNTVSKVINNKDGVSQKTKNMILQYIASAEAPGKDSLSSAPVFQIQKYVVFTYHHENAEYFNDVLANVEATLKANGYSLLMNIIHGDTTGNIPIPPSLYDSSACGVISFNIFDEQYWEEIISLNIPSVFIDTFYNPYRFINKTDIVTVECSGPIHNLVNLFIEKGAASFGFVGPNHFCYSMFQKWLSLKATLEENNLVLDESKCILNTDSFNKSGAIQYAKELLCQMEKIPEVFICADDLCAVITSKALQELGYTIPDDVSIVGFNNSSETQRQTPPLSTVDAHPDLIGQSSAQMLIDRLNNPELPHKFILTQSDIILRDSTNL